MAKSGKEPNLENLHPISLTSCVGKFMEQMALQRLQPHLEKAGTFSDTMFGLWERLSTQDIMLQPSEDIIEPISRTTTEAVLVLENKGAFDNVGHALILRNIARTNCGARTRNYVKDFLSNHTATISTDDLMSDILNTPNKGTPDKGTPQGSVISLTLFFNLAMRGLPTHQRRHPRHTPLALHRRPHGVDNFRLGWGEPRSAPNGSERDPAVIEKGPTINLGR